MKKFNECEKRLKPYKDEVISFYEEEAKIYDAERFSTALGRYMDRSQKELVLDMVNSWGNKKILEVGCGTGRFTIEIANQGNFIVGLDPSIPMLKKVDEKVNDVNIVGTIDLINGSGHELPFKDDTFDGCICINVINHLPDYDKMFREVYRILKPNGFFIMNFSNILSLFLPVGLWINLRKRSIINDVYTQYYTLRKISRSLGYAGFKIKVVKGSISLPAFLFPQKLIFILKKMDEISRDSFFKYISGDLFIGAKSDKI